VAVKSCPKHPSRPPTRLASCDSSSRSSSST
jgi:hypothetical protein